jgi:hypothetical protein
MGRSSEPASARRGRDVVVAAGLGIILLFAIVGVVSAGIWVGGKVSGGSHQSAPPKSGKTGSTGSATAQANIARAQAQATRIVKTAQETGKSILTRETAKAKSQAASIVTTARQRAAAYARKSASLATTRRATAAAGGQTSAPAAGTGGQTSSTAAGTGTQTYSAAGTTGTSSYGSTTGTQGYSYGSTAGTGAQGYTSGSTGYSATGSYGSSRTLSGTSAASANLSNLPSSWLVVGYNATFGRGPGSAGSITVTNRSGKMFRGVARVVYSTGGSASAAFSGLAPGQTLVLPLNGSAYRGGKYSIQLTDLH